MSVVDCDSRNCGVLPTSGSAKDVLIDELKQADSDTISVTHTLR